MIATVNIQRMFFILSLLVFVYLLPLSQCQDSHPQIFYVTPTDPPNEDCPGEPCFTLNHYAGNYKKYFARENASIVLKFMNGVHNLTKNFSMPPPCYDFDKQCYNVKSVTMTGLSHNVTIQVLHGNSVFEFHVLEMVVIENIKIVNREIADSYSKIVCGGNVTIQSVTFVLNTIIITSGNNWTIKDTKFMLESRQYALEILYHRYDWIQLYIANVTIVDLYPNKITKGVGFPDIMMINADPNPYWTSNLVELVTILIVNSSFTRRSGCGMYTHYPHTKNFNVTIQGTNISMHQNGGIVIEMPTSINSNFYFLVENSAVVGNTIATCSIISKVPTDWYGMYCSASGISLVNAEEIFNSSTIIFQNSSFNFNSYLCDDSPVIDFNRNLEHNITIRNCEFNGNKGTPLSVYNSNIYFYENNTFFNNAAYQGGAMFLSSSYVYFTSNMFLLFSNNTATYVGGAIYVDQLGVHLLTRSNNQVKCFYQLELNYSTNIFDSMPSVAFEHNTARHGGDHLYGALLLHSNCIVTQGHITQANDYIDDSLFQFEPPLEQSLSPISSRPMRVCLCNNSNSYQAAIKCTNVSDILSTLSREIYPGEVFTISVVVVGADYGTTTGSVYAQLLPLHSSSPPSLAPLYQSQPIENYSTCTQLSYSIHSPDHSEVLVLTTTDKIINIYGDKEALVLDNPISPILRFNTPIYINITLLECPPGFILSSETHGCVCDNTLIKHHILCNITNGTGYVYRTRTAWVNVSFDERDNSSGVIVVRYCPYDYCDTTKVKVDLRYPDTQCNFNRSGTLCGRCVPKYSLALGSNRCLPCSDNNLALMIFFIAAGFLLVAFIRIFNLTVQHGTINGLIFYANIVWAYRSILFPVSSDSQTHGFTYGIETFLQVFIAWLNLDFGIESCFFVGLSAYWKTWLQFVFPLYIWVIAGVIIFTAEHSRRAANIIGRNGVPILATLFLLSYTKLLKTIITVLNFSFLDNPSGTRSVVWSVDGNLQYCRFPHIFLFLAAVSALLFLWLPFTFVLLLAQWLKKISHFKLLHWIDNYRVRPFLDHYFAPMKDKHRYWLGVLLLVRIFLLVTFAFTSTRAPTANFLVLGVTVVLLILYLGLSRRPLSPLESCNLVYKQKCSSMLDNLFFCNLLVLTIAILYLDSDLETYETTRAAIAYASIGAAFVKFNGIVLYHVWMQVYEYRNRDRKGYLMLDESNEERNKISNSVRDN